MLFRSFILTMKPKHVFAFISFLCYLFWVSGGLRVLTSYRTSTRGSGVMRCGGMLTLFGLYLFITQPWLCEGMLYDDVCNCCSVAHQSSCVKLRCLCMRHLSLPIFGVIDQLYLDYLFSRHDGTEVWIYI